MYTGWNSTGRRDWRTKARRVITSIPALGWSRRPVRERPPSMKYSIESPRAMSVATYSLNTAE